MPIICNADGSFESYVREWYTACLQLLDLNTQSTSLESTTRRHLYSPVCGPTRCEEKHVIKCWMLFGSHGAYIGTSDSWKKSNEGKKWKIFISNRNESNISTNDAYGIFNNNKRANHRIQWKKEMAACPMLNAYYLHPAHLNTHAEAWNEKSWTPIDAIARSMIMIIIINRNTHVMNGGSSEKCWVFPLNTA